MADYSAILCQVGSSNTPSIQTVATALSANTGRAGWGIQNQGTNPLFVRLGDSASTTVFHIILKGGSAVNDGNGGTFTQTQGTVYQGKITTSGIAPTYTVFEL